MSVVDSVVVLSKSCGGWGQIAIVHLPCLTVYAKVVLITYKSNSDNSTHKHSRVINFSANQSSKLMHDYDIHVTGCKNYHPTFQHKITRGLITSNTYNLFTTIKTIRQLDRSTCNPHPPSILFICMINSILWFRSLLHSHETNCTPKWFVHMKHSGARHDAELVVDHGGALKSRVLLIKLANRMPQQWTLY